MHSDHVVERRIIVAIRSDARCTQQRMNVQYIDNKKVDSLFIQQQSSRKWVMVHGRRTYDVEHGGAADVRESHGDD